MENDKLKKLIRKAEVDNTMKRIKMGDFKGRREVHQNNPNFDLGRKPTNPNLNVEGVQKAGHPEAFELGLDSETMNNPEYQAILHQKRKTRALQSVNPKLNRVDTDDVSQEDIEAADKAASRRKRIGESVGAPMKQQRAKRVLKSKRLRGAPSPNFSTGTNDVVRKAIRSRQIRLGVGGKIKMSHSGGGSVNLYMPDMQSRTRSGRDIPRSGQMGATRDAIRKEQERRRVGKFNNPFAAMMGGGLDREITLRGEDEQRKAAKEGGKALRRRKRIDSIGEIGEAMEKQGMLFKTQAEPETTTVVPAVVGKDRKRGTDKRSRENKKKFNPKNVGKEAY